MAITGHGWYAANALRRYPLHDTATGEADPDPAGGAGPPLPDDLVVDLALRWPDGLGRYAFLAAAAVTPGGLVTLVFEAAAAADAAAGYSPVAAVTAAAPAQGRLVDLVPMAAGAAGWVVFGPGVARVGRWLFSSPAQSLVAPRAGRAYRAAAVTGLGKGGVGAAPAGLVRLAGGGDVEVVGADRTIGGVRRRAAVVRLRDVPGRNLFDEYRGPCSGRPESGTCRAAAVETVNGVSPDCDGDLTVTTAGGLTVTPAAGGGGLVLNYPLGMAAACQTADRLPTSSGVLPGEAADGCPAGYAGTDPDPETGLPTIPPAGSSAGVGIPPPAECATLPYEETFADTTAGWFSVVSGVWGVAAPDGGPPASSSLPGGGNSYRQTDPAARGVSLWHACAYADSRGLYAEADAAVDWDGAGPAGAGGLVLNWHVVEPDLREEYYLLAVDRRTSRVVLKFYNGAWFVDLAGAPVTFAPDVPIRLRCEVTAYGSRTKLACSAAPVGGGPGATFAVAVSGYAPADGEHGLGTDGAEARFYRFAVGAV